MDKWRIGPGALLCAPAHQASSWAWDRKVTRPPRLLLGPLIAIHPFQSNSRTLIPGDQNPVVTPSPKTLAPTFSLLAHSCSQLCETRRCEDDDCVAMGPLTGACTHSWVDVSLSSGFSEVRYPLSDADSSWRWIPNLHGGGDSRSMMVIPYSASAHWQGGGRWINKGLSMRRQGHQLPVRHGHQSTPDSNGHRKNMMRWVPKTLTYLLLLIRSNIIFFYMIR
jgi:hypothetical protein